MAKPIIMTVDDEPHVLNAIARDLQAHYQSDYRIVKASSGDEALETVQELKRRNNPIALLLADQRMPSVTGVDVLRASLEHYPDTKKALLTAYADTEAAISLLVNGFCQEVFRTLPLEFAVEAVRLLEMKLEDSVG